MQNSKETPLSEQTNPSPQSKRKSKRHEMGTPASPSLNEESERQQKNDAPTPLRRSERGKISFSSGSSGSKKSEEDSSQSYSKRKKKRALIQVTMESEKAELELEPISINRNKMNARTFRALFKRQRIQEFAPELEGSDKSSHNCSDGSKGVSSKPMVNGEDRSIDKVSDGALWMSTFNKKGCLVDVEDDINVQSSIRENDLDEPLPLASQTSLGVKILDYEENLPSNEKMDTPQSESSTCLVQSRDGSVSSESEEEWIRLKGSSPSPSLEYDNRNLMGICALCSKNKRVGYDSLEQELCTCSPTKNNDTCRSSSEDRNGHEAAVAVESTEDYLREVNEGSEAIDQGRACSFCYKDGKLLLCVGRGCSRCYHLYCLDPPLTDVLPGAWHCPQCVKKKLLFGVHSVSKGAESVWDVREVEMSNVAGVKQKQYLVKYHGLSHIHNQWVPEKQLLHEKPNLIAKFIDNNKTMRWCTDWTVPQRLLRRRIIQDNIYIASSTVISVCNYEWLVKWCGLSYDDATWELECAPFLGTSPSQKLMNDYETRRKKARQEANKHLKASIAKFSNMTAIQSLVTEKLLKNVRKLRECLFKLQNAVIFDDQDWVTTIIRLIQSMSEIGWPYLIVTASSLLSQWEAKFSELAPSVDVVAYVGNSYTRKGARASEFYDEEGYMMLQVLLTSPEVLLEDLDILKSIRWEAVVIDEHQHSWASDDFEHIKKLTTDSRILLCGAHIKDSAPEYLRLLSLLESQDDFDKLRGLKAEPNDYICKLRDRLSCFSAYGSTSQASKFLEYWVPAEMSNHQLEQYCFTLLSNATLLQSCSTKDSIDAVRGVLSTVRKCCDHPYLLDPSVQERLIAEKCTASDLLDIGIKASGKLQLLDMMLSEIKAQGLQVLILFQLIMRSGGAVSTGDILDDYLRQRFGQYTYERVETGILSSKKQAAVDRFNKKENGPFAFLIETRACTSIIKKLSSVDAVIIYDSDWNPANDLRALQKISVDSKAGQIKVFRLYSCFTVEERALVLSKQSLNRENQLQNFTRATSDSLLSWGAIDLFKQLDKYHANGSSTSDQMLLNEVTKEFQVLLSGCPEDTVSNAVVSKARLGVQSYIADIPLFGESKVELRDGVEPHVFWSNLFYGKNPQWKHLSDPGPRNRKRVRPLGGSMNKPDTEKDDVAKKPRRMGDSLDPAVVQAERGVNKEFHVTVAKGGFSVIDKSQNLPNDDTTSNADQNCMSGPRCSGEDSLLSFLHGQMTRLCQILQLSEDVTHAMRRFLEYIIKNHHVNNDSPSIMHAFQISLCWIAASIRKQKVDKKDSLMLAKQLLNYQCSEEQVVSVYSKMRLLKRMYLQSSECIDSDLHGSFAGDDTNQERPIVHQGNPEFLSYKQKHKKAKIGEESGSEELSLLLKEFPLTNSTAGEIDTERIRILKKGNKKMRKLKLKHQNEIEGFHESWDKKRVKLETDRKLECAMIRSIHDQGSVRINKLSLLDDKFSEKMEEHYIQKNEELKKLEARQLAAVDELRQKVYQLMEARVCPSELRAVNVPEAHGSHSEEDAGDLLQSTDINVMGIEGAFTMGMQNDQNQCESLCIAENDNAPSVITPSVPAVALSSGTPVEIVSNADLQNVGGMQPALGMAELLSQSEHFCDNGETVLGSLSAPGEKESGGCQRVDASKEFLTKAILIESEGAVHHVELNNTTMLESSRVSNTPDTSVSGRDELGKDAIGDLQEQTREQVEEAISIPGCSESLPCQAPQSTIGESSVPADVPASQNQTTSDIEVRIAEPVDVSAATQSNQEGTDVTALQSNNDASATENSSELNPPAAAALSCNGLAIGDHNRGRSSSTTAEFFREPILSQESISVARESFETRDVDIGPVTDVGHGQMNELLEFPQNNGVTSPIEVRSVEQTNQAVPPVGVNPSCGPGYLAHPTNQPHPNSTHSLLPDPLQIQLDRMCEEAEQLEKYQESSVLQLKLECENEIQEIVSQIRKKYDFKIQETEAEYRLKKIELDKNKNKVLMNKILAEAFRSKCLDLKASRLPGGQQGTHARQVSTAPFPVTSSSQPTSQPTTTSMQPLPPSSQPYPDHLSPVSGQTAPHPQSIQRPPLISGQTAPHPQSVQRPLMSNQTTLHPQPIQRPPFISVQTTPAPHPQPIQRPPRISAIPSRPPLVIGSISPSGNPRVNGEIRSRAPHLQAFRPRPVPTSSPLASQLHNIQSQTLKPNRPVASPPPPVQPNIISEDRLGQPEPPVGMTLSSDQNISTLRSTRDTESFPAVPQVSSSSMSGAGGALVGEESTGVVCLSDDE